MHSPWSPMPRLEHPWSLSRSSPGFSSHLSLLAPIPRTRLMLVSGLSVVDHTGAGGSLLRQSSRPPLPQVGYLYSSGDWSWPTFLPCLLSATDRTFRSSYQTVRIPACGDVWMDSSGSNVHIQRGAGALSQLFNPGRLLGPILATYITPIHVLKGSFPTITLHLPSPNGRTSVLPMVA